MDRSVQRRLAQVEKDRKKTRTEWQAMMKLRHALAGKSPRDEHIRESEEGDWHTDNAHWLYDEPEPDDEDNFRDEDEDDIAYCPYCGDEMPKGSISWHEGFHIECI